MITCRMFFVVFRCAKTAIQVLEQRCLCKINCIVPVPDGIKNKQALRNSCELLRQRKELHASSWNCMKHCMEHTDIRTCRAASSQLKIKRYYFLNGLLQEEWCDYKNIITVLI